MFPNPTKIDGAAVRNVNCPVPVIGFAPEGSTVVAVALKKANSDTKGVLTRGIVHQKKTVPISLGTISN